MKVIRVEGLATHDIPESCASAGNSRREALTGVGIDRVLSRERNEPLRGADLVKEQGRPLICSPRRSTRYSAYIFSLSSKA